MDPFVAKILFFGGVYHPDVRHSGPYIKQQKTLTFRQDWKRRADTALFVITSVGSMLLPLLYIFTPLFQFADYHGSLWIGIVGAVLLLLGDRIFYLSHRDLGKNWSPILEIREEHSLVTEGIYHRIRHPMYSATWILVLAQAMILPNWIAGFSALVPFSLVYFLRVGKEERMMVDVFGDEYVEYQRQTGRLLPKIRPPSDSGS